ncbi:MAG TPA: hypothetical protein VER96_31660 [Polyangiaceae bacterium]|nr:hypothetical protein [Polyangiaceae bacterium]
MSIIDPNLLQLVGLGAQGDADLPDGRHLRWLFHRLLGFPRTGFRLARRPSLLGVNFEAPPPGSPPVRAQLTRQAELGAAARVRFPSGLTVSKAGGFVFGPATSGGQSLLRIDEAGLALDFGAEGATPPTSGELLSSPAAYVLLTVARRKRSGLVVARGFYDGRPTRRLVDQAAIGGDLRAHLADLAVAIATVGDTQRALSRADRVTGAGAIARRDALAVMTLAVRGLGVRWARPPIADPNPFVIETLLLHGGLLEHLDVTGHDAALLRVQWVTSRDLVAASGWVDVGRYFLPLTDAPSIYPAWTTDSTEKVARTRLAAAPPRRAAPWDREDGGAPPLLLDAAPVSVAASLAARYLGAELKPIDAAMREFLKRELTELVPQALVRVSERVEPDPTVPSAPEPMTVAISPFDMLYGASADPQVARLLGLSTVDAIDPPGVYDYVVEAGFPALWVQRLLQPATAKTQLARLQGQLGGAPIAWNGDRADRAFRPLSIISVLTGLRQAPAATLAAPSDLQAEVIPDAARAPVQARVRLHWAPGAGNLFQAADDARVLHVLTRASAGGDRLLHHRDDDTKLLAPHLPTPYGAPTRLNLVDRALPSYGEQTWKVAAMDLFGRMSPSATVTADVRDTLAPPPPARVAARLPGDATAGPAWTGLEIGFDWLPAHEALAPDLKAFELSVRQGVVTSAEEPLDATWGKLETTPGATTAALRLSWPLLAVEGAPSSTTIAVSTTPLDGGGQRITVTLSPVAIPYDSSGYARVAVAARAIDAEGNASAFAVARVERVDLFVPPPPSYAADPLLATPPDAHNRCWLRLPLPALPNCRVRVLRAPAVALLAASGTSAEAFEALSVQDRVGLLRTLAVTHREPFAADHTNPRPADGGAYLVELGGFDRGLTVLTLVVENANGARAPWPTTPGPFLVGTVPRVAALPVPLVRELRVSDRSATFTISADPTRQTRTLAVYRTRAAADADDVRRMRLVAEVALTDPNSDAPTQLIDAGLFEEVDYFYRLVAIGEGGLRSSPTGAMRVTPLPQGPPTAPVVRAIERDAAQPSLRRVRLLIARRDYPVYLLRRLPLAPTWEAARGTTVGADGLIDVAALAATPDPAGYELVIEDLVAAPDERYSYMARVQNRRGRATAGQPLGEPA